MALRPLVDLPSESSTIAAGGGCSSALPCDFGLLRRAVTPVAIASPLAVPPLGVIFAIASRASSRSVDGDARIVGVWLNAITPTFTRAGTLSRNARAACLAATSRLGFTSVACIEPETSVASRIDARSIGSAIVRCGRAAAAISTIIASRNARIGRCRRQRGRRGATDGCMRASANASAARRRRCCSPA
jgi:hypothetical protein